jgi:hypothetical protein
LVIDEVLSTKPIDTKFAEENSFKGKSLLFGKIENNASGTFK